MTEVSEPKFNAATFCLAYESGELSQEEIVTGFQHLIDSEVVWSLQGRYGRMAERLIRSGECTRPEPKAPVPGQPYNVGPYVDVTRDTIRTVAGRKFRLVLYRAYNAMGLVGYECNGVAVLQEDPPQVVCDELGLEASGWGGNSPKQVALFEQLVQCPDEEFREAVNTSRRARFTI